MLENALSALPAYASHFLQPFSRTPAFPTKARLFRDKEVPARDTIIKNMTAPRPGPTSRFALTLVLSGLWKVAT